MKKLVCTLALIAGSLAVRAQQFNLTEFNEAMKYQQAKDLVEYLNKKPVSKQDSIRKSHIRNQLLKNQLANTVVAAKSDRMPVIKTDRTFYSMPVVGTQKVKGYLLYKNKSGADSIALVK